MSWKELKRQYNAITQKAKLNEDYTKEWKSFKKLAYNIEKKPPPAVYAIHKSLKLIDKSKEKNNIYIGCV